MITRSELIIALKVTLLKKILTKDWILLKWTSPDFIQNMIATKFSRSDYTGRNDLL